MKDKYNPLFEPLHFTNGMIARNRVAMAPMTHYSSNKDGSMNPEELPYFQRRAKGVGIVFTHCYAVTENGVAYQGEPLISDDRFIPDLKKIAQTIQKEGALAVLQLHHGGAVCPPALVPGGDVVAPCAVQIPERGHVVPRALSDEEIINIIKAFGDGTRRAIEAGFDGVELHGAYGYLLQQFISPFSNQRDDQWGKKYAFPLTLIKHVKEVIKKCASAPFLLGYRFTPEEALKPGLSMADALHFTEALVQSDIDFIDVLINDYRSKPRAGLVDLSEKRLCLIRRQVAGRLPVFGGGAIFTAEEGLEALGTGIDAITIGRELIIDPEWVQKIQDGKEESIVTEFKKDDTREMLTIPFPFWQVIWCQQGWFPGTLKE